MKLIASQGLKHSCFILLTTENGLGGALGFQTMGWGVLAENAAAFYQNACVGYLT